MDNSPYIVFYDGSCKFCLAGKARLLSIARPGTLIAVDSQDAEALSRYPQLSPEKLGKAMQLICPDGSVLSGAAAIAKVLSTRPGWSIFAWIYRVPGLRQLADALYALVAANRHRISFLFTGKASNSLKPCTLESCGIPSATTPPTTSSSSPTPPDLRPQPR